MAEGCAEVMAVPYREPQDALHNPLEDCALCGREIPKWWYAEVVSRGVLTRLCHRDTDKPTCYERWTVYGERPVGWELNAGLTGL